MLSRLERKTAWSLAAHAAEATPDGMQRLFTTAPWDAGGVRTAEGKTKTEIMRCLKRYIAREVSPTCSQPQLTPGPERRQASRHSASDAPRPRGLRATCAHRSAGS